MSVINETLLLTLSTSITHIVMDVEKIYGLASQLSRALLTLLLQMRRQLKAFESTSLTGGEVNLSESIFDAEEIIKVLHSSSSSTVKVMLITTYLYKAWPFIKETIYDLQMKLSLVLALSAQLKHAYNRISVLPHTTQEFQVLEQEINILIVKLDLQILQSRDGNERLLKNLMDAHGILTTLSEFENAKNLFSDINVVFLNMSLESGKTWELLKAIKPLELKIVA